MDPKKNLIFLHGWGVSSKIFKPLFYFLRNDFEIYAVDLPGFGAAPIENQMSLKDYAEFVLDFIQKNKIKDPIVAGHSFGGAAAAKSALLYPESISKLVLIGSAAIREPDLKIRALAKAAKIFKKFFPEKSRAAVLKILNLGETDYAKIENPVLKETFKKIIKENLAAELAAIKIPTLVVWGEKDEATPLKEGIKTAELIRGAELVVVKNAGHFMFLEKPNEFAKIIKKFAL